MCMCSCVCVCLNVCVCGFVDVSLASYKTYRYVSITVDHAANTRTWGFIMHLQRNTGGSTDTQRLGLNEEATLLTTEQQKAEARQEFVETWNIVRTL